MPFVSNPHLSGSVFGCSGASKRVMHSILRFDWLLRHQEERTHCQRSDQNERCSDGEADVAESAAGRVSRRNAPFGGKQPQSIGEMPRSAENAHAIKSDRPTVLKFQLHFAEGRVGMT